MDPLIMPAVLATTILFSMLAFYLVKKKRASAPSKISPTLEGIREGIRNDHYDVFLSFRGSDTRKGFTDHLYHSLVKVGIAPVFVFKDDKSIQIGEEFGPEILNAIARSKISILIISENYASSKWCLRELIHIMDRAKSPSHTVLPIFYKVDPSDVGDLKGNFGKKASHTCKKYKKYFNEENIQKVKKALEDVSHLQGWESQKVDDGHEGELVKKVIENVLSKLRQDYQLDVTKHLVGIDDHVNRIMKWVPSVVDTPSTTDARMIGIYGMGGIGKTTLAKVIYNQLSNDFVHRSFLADIRETARRNNIAYLQKQLIKDILQIEPSNVDEGISWIKSGFRGKKVLILLDDIDKKDQLNALARECNWFMAGSIIIVTTRYEAILDQSEFKVDKYDLNELDQEHALLLFNRHAFCMDYSPRDFEGISGDIVSTMGGLPLAVEVVGSYLYKKMNRGVWEDVLDKLKNQPHGDVQKTLRISFDALEDGHKQIFLDIVCFFIGETSEYAMYMWKDCGFYPSEGIEELKLRCLIKIGDYGKFKVHDQLRDLGRSIFCQGQPLEQHSGPWDDDYEGVPKVLRHLERHPRFHDLLGAASSEHSKQLLSEVRWLRWDSIKSDASTANLHLPKLSVLQCSYSDIMDWEGWRSFMASKQLKVLDLSPNWPNLKRTPDLSAFTQLKILMLRGCQDLEHLHPSIRELTSLVSLDLSRCESLKELPPEVGKLKSLESLNLYDCKRLEKLPEEVGKLRSLVSLDLQYCESLKKLPEEVGKLTSLVSLNLSRCERLEELPEEVGKLTSLVSLDLSFCFTRKKLPEVGELKDLEELILDATGITEIPPSIASLTKLKKLSVEDCAWLTEIPSFIGDLHNLQHLHLKDSAIEELPSAIGSLRKLENLSVKFCNLLKEIPSSIGNLQNLQHLDLSYSAIEKLPSAIGRLKNLRTLRLSSCKSLKGAILSEIGDLPSLENLILSFTPISDLPESVRNLSSLQRLHLYDCEELRSLPELPSSVTGLWFTCKSLGLPQLLSLKHNLERITLTVDHLLEDICELSSRPLKLCFEEWDKLTLLSLHGLEHLEELSIKKCNSIETLELSPLIHLKRLRIEHCNSLVKIQSFGNLESLEVIFLYECKRLERLDASGCGKLVEIQGLDGAKFLEELDFTGCKSIKTLPDLTGFEKLRSLRVRDCKKLTQLQGLEKLNSIELDISGCDSLEPRPNLSGHRAFRNYKQELSFDFYQKKQELSFDSCSDVSSTEGSVLS